MPDDHPLVNQLHFARANFVMCLENVSEKDAKRRLNSMNCLSWTIGHLANQEHRYWVEAAQNKTLFPKLNGLVGYKKPASTPELEEMWTTWKLVTAEADKYLDTVTVEELEGFFSRMKKNFPESIGTMLLRNIYHYWFHIGEARTIMELLGYGDLPEYIGDMSSGAYLAEER